MRSLQFLVLRCRDLEAARRFYECFEMTFTKHAHGAGPEHYAHEDERGVFELYPAGEGAPAEATGLGFAAADLSAVREQLARLGLAPQPIRQQPWGRTFVVRDPDGRRVEVKKNE
jgi:hypothetical protein